MIFKERLKKGIILFDGAMGTQIQVLQPTDAEWDGKLGCSEVLNLTAPQKIQTIHENYLNAGSDVIETNTFGANDIVLSEYDLQNRVIEINRIAAQIARHAANRYFHLKPRYVAGSIGPGTKLISLGQTDYATMYQSYANQAQGLIEGGVDLFIIETCQDLLQIKITLQAVNDKMVELAVELPVIVSVTVEKNGTLLVGSEIGAVLATLAPFQIAALGINCATGPKHMHPYIKEICQQFNGPVICQPNAGLPQNINGELVYNLSIEEFVSELISFVEEDGVQIVGGCCGTTPEFIASLAQRLKNAKIARRQPKFEPAISSLFSAQTLKQYPAPFFVGERTNANGSKQFREYMLNNDWNGMVTIAQQQQRTGAHGLDLCVAYTGRDEIADMTEMVQRIVRQVNSPLFIDSTDIQVIENALKLYGGRAVINSINLESGEERVNNVCRLAKRYGAAVIALTIDEQGMALEIEKKVAIAKRIYDIALKQGLQPQDLIFDGLTFTLGSGDESLEQSAANTILAVAEIKNVLPGVFTILGISNVSFGLFPHSREILNSVFLSEAVQSGLDLAILNVNKILPLHQIDPADRQRCLDLIYNRGENPLIAFIHHFKHKSGEVTPTADKKLSLNEKIKQRVIDGNRSGIDKLLLEAIKTKKPLEVINDWLIPAMKKVGELFGAGEMQLPFVLQSAEVMKYAVGVLQPYLEKVEHRSQTKLVLATVRGDVHDIGKNLVDIILSNNGFKVYNLGIKCEIETMLQKAREVEADAIGMSGLLVKSTIVMKENLQEMQRRNIQIPVLLGGAALTRDYVATVCQPIISASVIYCSDAFEGLKTMELIKSGKLATGEKTTIPKVQFKKLDLASPQKVHEKIDHNIAIPKPPFWGNRIVTDIDLDDVLSFLNEPVLFRGRWGYRRGKLSKAEYEQLLQNEVRPAFELLKKQCHDKKLLAPAVVYGYYPCNSSGNDVILYHPDSDKETLRFTFPRQQRQPFRCIADYFLPINSRQKDVIVLQVVTMGQTASEESKRLFESDLYKNYLLFHGLSVESAEALAEYWHLKVRRELDIITENGVNIQDFVEQKYHGSRYSFGYPACPDLSENRKIFNLLQPERIGVTLTEQDQMVPEQTTSAFIVHFPQAKYFSI